jgi:hypothetical protein
VKSTLPKRHAVSRQQLAQLRELIAIVVAGQAGEVVRHFLHADHVEVGHLPRGAHDALEVDALVDAAAPLDVPGDELHGGNEDNLSA